MSYEFITSDRCMQYTLTPLFLGEITPLPL
jgi:hypothetical protein